ncbi:MAG: hypothetical protein JJU11_16825 [Candidatus Sumerlaeia bacterium]|nr:hypothetical protein [Candidatus Sumerlaeia bacterium]
MTDNKFMVTGVGTTIPNFTDRTMMNTFPTHARAGRLAPITAGILVVCLLFFSISATGCATLISGTDKNVSFVVTPPDKHVYYEGREIRDGDMVTVSKSLSGSNRVNVGTRERPIETELRRDLDPWFIGSCALLLVFFLPGVAAIAVDLITGAAMEPKDTQIYHVPAN